MIRAQVSMLIKASASRIYDAFIDPENLTKFWLSSASAPLRVGRAAHWEFMVKGAVDDVTATRLEAGTKISWRFSDGSTVEIDLEAMDDETAVTVVNANFPGRADEQREAALNSAEGFAIVLCDLKTFLETGHSARLVQAKAKLIETRAKE
jgi:uncharacterized protein YndB with AHSA1/START domain